MLHDWYLDYELYETEKKYVCFTRFEFQQRTIFVKWIQKSFVGYCFQTF